MKRIALFVLLLATFSHATTTVTGKIQTLGTGNITSGAFARFWLRGCRGNQPRVSGVSVIGPSQGGVYFFDISADSGGNVTGTIYSTRDATGLLGGEIECGGSLTAVWYGLQIFVAGKGGPELPVHAKSGGALDISSVTPITTNPVVTAPTGDTTYLRLDAGNVPFLGNLTPNGNGVLSLGISANRWKLFGSTLDVSGNSILSGTLNVGGALTVGGLQVKVSGTACGQALDLFNIDSTPTNPHKYFRINQSTGALEIMNSACGALIASIDDAGNVILPGTTAGETLSGGKTSVTSTPNAFTISSLGTFNLSSNHFPGNPLTLTTPNGSPGIALGALGGALNLNSGANCAAGPVCSPVGTLYGFGVLNSNSYFNSYNGINLVGMGFPAIVYNTASASVNANIGATTMVTAPTLNSGCPATLPANCSVYDITWYMDVSAVGASCAGATTVVANVLYTDPSGAGQNTLASSTLTVAATNGVLGAFISSGRWTIVAQAASVIQYSTTSFTAGGSCSPAPKYQLLTLVKQIS